MKSQLQLARLRASPWAMTALPPPWHEAGVRVWSVTSYKTCWQSSHQQQQQQQCQHWGLEKPLTAQQHHSQEKIFYKIFQNIHRVTQSHTWITIRFYSMFSSQRLHGCVTRHEVQYITVSSRPKKMCVQLKPGPSGATAEWRQKETLYTYMWWRGQGHTALSWCYRAERTIFYWQSALTML